MLLLLLLLELLLLLLLLLLAYVFDCVHIWGCEAPSYNCVINPCSSSSSSSIVFASTG